MPHAPELNARSPLDTPRAHRRLARWWIATAFALAAAFTGANARAEVTDTATVPTFLSVPGIPRDVVPSLAQDGEGFLWVGTGDGLARYDGYRLKSVEREGSDPLARNMGWIRTMVTGPDGRVWMGTESAGLAVYDPDQRRILNLGGPEAGPQHAIIALALDGERRVWIGTVGGGLLRYDEGRKHFERLALPALAQDDVHASAITRGKDGTMWIGHRHGLARWRPGAAAAEVVALPPHPRVNGPDTVQALLATEEGRLWLGTQHGDLGILEANDAFRWLPAAERGGIQALAFDGHGQLWVGHRSGLDLIDPASGALRQRLRHRGDQPGGLAGNDVTQILRAANGAMWVAGYGVGLQRHASSPAIAIRGPDANPDSPLGYADVRALVALDAERILAATATGRVAVLDAALRVQGAWPAPGPAIEAMARDATGDLWMAGGGRAWRFSPEGRIRGQWDTEAGRSIFLRAGPDGTLWLGADRGLLRLRPGASAFEPVTDRGGTPLAEEIFAMTADGKGGWWVGGRAGLFRIVAGENVLTPTEAAPGHELGFPLVLGLLLDRRGQLWVDTPVAGLHRLEGVDAQGRLRFERISVRHGIVGRPFGANLHEDERGRLWSQAFIYDPSADRLDELRPADGVQIGTPWFGADARLPDGRLLFGGSRGVMRVDPRRFEVSEAQPPLVVTGLRIDGLPHRPRSLREGLVLPPGRRSFGVEFAALEYADPQRVRYRYRLAGYDPDWLPTDASFRSPSYSELRPGAYTFEVQATNRNGIWNPKTLRLPVTVQPRWWQTLWAHWAFGLLVIAAVSGVVRLRTAQLRRRQGVLEAMVAERTRELEEASLTDPLTGLRNRRHLMRHIEDDLRRARAPTRSTRPNGRQSADLLVFVIDLDHFKTINDRYGHAIGDALLVQTAGTLRHLFREGDTLVRWGGEEFLVIARDSDRHRAGELAERLRCELRDMALRLPGDEDASVSITASIGFVAYPPDRSTPDAWSLDAVLQLADAALYAAKSRGRNRWVGVTAIPAAVAGSGDAADWLGHPDTVVRQSD
ncbi:ligand-binding sensor domain-containing diguanylate cyclase [Silanimonas sp.]|uniref:ligand-binding sensor domain-containing diguanylate cyclase n=1 Tax=Silanimonas sp. TaxID=1929290 RepID=UPI0022CAFE03|nr:ligand-binding sensor domain-containing diguanylate cyclase [Silanimonas sp.]MCZ8166413.1 diguanylate cyclase [Silanimonas sp.]